MTQTNGPSNPIIYCTDFLEHSLFWRITHPRPSTQWALFCQPYMEIFFSLFLQYCHFSIYFKAHLDHIQIVLSQRSRSARFWNKKTDFFQGLNCALQHFIQPGRTHISKRTADTVQRLQQAGAGLRLKAFCLWNIYVLVNSILQSFILTGSSL